MQSCDMPERAFARFEEEARQQRLGKIHHEHLGNGQVRVKEVFTGTSDRAVHEAMDARAELLTQMGARNFRRTRIGRNSPCPCGSGLKLKKCCINAATSA